VTSSNRPPADRGSTGGSASVDGQFALTPSERALLGEARRIVLCTVTPTGLPRPVPICFALVEGEIEGELGALRLYTPLDYKTKHAADPRRLARVLDISDRPDVTLLADRWDEDWTCLAWLRLHGTARLLEPQSGAASLDREHSIAVAALCARYTQYATHDLSHRPIVRVVITSAFSWAS
jgi:PPOX class probable F420-dependent enzyme